MFTLFFLISTLFLANPINYSAFTSDGIEINFSIESISSIVKNKSKCIVKTNAKFINNSNEIIKCTNTKEYDLSDLFSSLYNIASCNKAFNNTIDFLSKLRFECNNSNYTISDARIIYKNKIIF